MNVPSELSRFVGRTDELAQIGALLSDPACRLLSLIGPGGIGKTRLALEAGRQFPLPEQVSFVPLQAVSAPDAILSTIADAVGFQFYSGDSPKQQLLDYLREKSCVLLLDNFEHMLESAGLLSEILASAPNVRLLVTSRARLHLAEEWALEVGGLTYPARENDGNSGSYSAIDLFVERARRAKVGFTLTDASRRAVAHICRLVGGMPLGIELAASWVRALSCEAIADEIARSLDILETPARNVEPRHRTMRAAFAPTWERLSDEERAVFMKLSVFRGGFTREAAETVAGASLRTLSALVDKSLVRVDENGRYDLHELLRQYAAEKLNESGEAEATAQRHLNYFANLAEQAAAHVYGREQLPWFDRLEIELNNIRAALTWSMDGVQVETGLRLAGSLGWFFQYRAHWKEGLTWLERILDLSSDADVSVRAKALLSAGELASMLGDLERAWRHGAEALALARQANDPSNIAWALTIAAKDGYGSDFERCVVLQEESLALFRTLEDPFGLSHALRRRAYFAIHQKDYAYARALLNEALKSANEVDDNNATAWSLLYLGALVWWQDQDAEQSKALFQKSLVLLREVQNVTEACFPLVMLARIEQVVGDLARCQEHYEETLVLAHEIGFGQDAIAGILLPGLGSLAAVYGNLERAARLLAAAESSIPGYFSFFPRAAFENEVASLRAQLGEAGFAAAWAEGKAMTSEQVVAYALQDETLAVETVQPHYNMHQTPAEPLSARELEILRLVADGLNNGEIADRLVLARSTIKWYVRQIFSKLDAASRTQAVARARTLGLLV